MLLEGGAQKRYCNVHQKLLRSYIRHALVDVNCFRLPIMLGQDDEADRSLAGSGGRGAGSAICGRGLLRHGFQLVPKNF